MHNIFVIYKTTTDTKGMIEDIRIVECDMDETSAIRFCKFHSGQVPHDLRTRIKFDTAIARVV